MGTVYARGDVLWIGFKDRAGRWRYRSTGLPKGQRRKALRQLERVEARLAAEDRLAPADLGPVTVRSFAEQWLARRERLGIREAGNDRGRLRKHVWPRLGGTPIAEVRVRHVRDLVTDLRCEGKLAPRTVHKIYGTMHTMFRDAVIEELIDNNPCVLAKDQLGASRDKDPEWRAGAIYSREELELFISHGAIPPDRRVLYGLKGLAGLRHGEAAGLRWRDYEPRVEPLGRLHVARSYDHARTKTGVARLVPVHPVLAAMLAEWRLAGWVQMMGAVPGPDDLIIPSRLGEMRSRHQARNKLLKDLARLGLRHRRGHDLRRTFITLCRADGARKDLLEMITHNPKRDIMDVYTTMPWPALCEEVAKLRVRRRPAPERGSTSPEGGSREAEAGDDLTTVLTTVGYKGRNWVANSWERHVFPQQSKVEAPGVEPIRRLRKLP